MASSFYNSGLQDLLDGTIPFTTTPDIRAVMIDDGYTFASTHTRLSDCTTAGTAGGTEITCSTASDQRVALTSETASINTAATPDTIECDAADITFSSVDTAQTAAHCILYKYNASDASAELLCDIDIADTPTNGGNITISWAAPAGATAGGIFNIPIS